MSLPATFSFTGTNGTTPPSANFTNFTNGLQIQSNRAAGANGSYCVAFWNLDTFNAAQYAKCLWRASVGGPAVRCQAGGNCYFLDCNDSGGSASFLFKMTADSVSGGNLQNLSSVFAAGDEALITMDAAHKIQCFKNSVQIGTDVTDSTFTTGSGGGMVLSTTGSFDTWEAGNLGAAPSFGPECFQPTAQPTNHYRPTIVMRSYVRRLWKRTKDGFLVPEDVLFIPRGIALT